MNASVRGAEHEPSRCVSPPGKTGMLRFPMSPLLRLWNQRDFRSNPARAVWRRASWRVRWQVTNRLWQQPFGPGLRIALRRRGTGVQFHTTGCRSRRPPIPPALRAAADGGVARLGRPDLHKVDVQGAELLGPGAVPSAALAAILRQG